jgi:hypothetical protein
MTRRADGKRRPFIASMHFIIIPVLDFVSLRAERDNDDAAIQRAVGWRR